MSAHHQRLARVLDTFDGTLLRTHGCLFGGGTAMALRYGEYRESVDIDFLVSDLDGYRAMRERLTGPAGIAALVRDGAVPPAQTRDMRADQYGVRTRLRADDGHEIKFELVFEGRILAKAFDQLRTRQGWLERCMAAMDMRLPRALLWQKLRGVARALPGPDSKPARAG